MVSFPRLQRPDGLSQAEWEVAQAAAAGRSNRAIARERGASEHTVANQLASVFAKLDVRGRQHLAVLLAGDVE